MGYGTPPRSNRDSWRLTSNPAEHSLLRQRLHQVVPELRAFLAPVPGLAVRRAVAVEAAEEVDRQGGHQRLSRSAVLVFIIRTN